VLQADCSYHGEWSDVRVGAGDAASEDARRTWMTWRLKLSLTAARRVQHHGDIATVSNGICALS